eukprot:GHVN01070830.1.p1 GENE.GHVN01070830.1~~GHVN01070830.1.p1  ORF type:complete len:326 (-),score=54.01 GHVN01070830.1:443-1420(-)
MYEILPNLYLGNLSDSSRNPCPVTPKTPSRGLVEQHGSSPEDETTPVPSLPSTSSSELSEITPPYPARTYGDCGGTGGSPARVRQIHYIPNINPKEVSVQALVRCCTKSEMRGANVECFPKDQSVLHVDVEDISQEKIHRWFDDVIGFVSKHRRRKKNVLIHCKKGRSRSPTVLLAYLLSPLFTNVTQEIAEAEGRMDFKDILLRHGDYTEAHIDSADGDAKEDLIMEATVKVFDEIKAEQSAMLFLMGIDAQDLNLSTAYKHLYEMVNENITEPEVQLTPNIGFFKALTELEMNAGVSPSVDLLQYSDWFNRTANDHTPPPCFK